MAETTASDDKAFGELAGRMTKTQQRDMADLLSSELKRRADEKRSEVRLSSKIKRAPMETGLGREQVGEIYSGIKDKVASARVKKLERQIEDAKQQAKRMGKKQLQAAAVGKARSMPKIHLSPTGSSLSRLALIYGIIALAVGKVVFATGVVDASTQASDTTLAPTTSQGQMLGQQAGLNDATVEADPFSPAAAARRGFVGWSYGEKQLLTALDARRVKLEKRSQALDRREEDLIKQAKVVTERLAQLRSLSQRLAESREEKEHRYEARLEQLATVYGSMAPQEAAPLIARLDDETALGLLQRLPGKRFGQILSSMPQDRAIGLTKLLSEEHTVE